MGPASLAPPALVPGGLAPAAPITPASIAPGKVPLYSADEAEALLLRVRAFLTALRPILAGTIAEASQAAWVEGASSVLEFLPASSSLPQDAAPTPLPLAPPAPPSPPLPPRPPTTDAGEPPPEEPNEPIVHFPGVDEQVEKLKAARVVTPEEYYTLAAAARSNAWTISGGLNEGTIEKVRDIVARNVDEGTNRVRFIREVREEVGTIPISAARLEQVYRNAVNEAFSQGHERTLDLPMVKDEFPYRAYYAITDHRCRATHRALEEKHGLNGTNVYHRDDPTWKKFRPPWEWNCRCGWTPLGIEDAAKMGVEEAKVWLETGVEPEHAWVASPSFEPPAAWRRDTLELVP